MAQKVIDGLLSPPGGRASSSVSSGEKALGSLPPRVPAIQALSGTVPKDSVHGVCWPAVSSNLGWPLELSYAGDSCECPESEAKALSAAVQGEEASEPHRPKHFAASATYSGLVTKTIPPSSPDFHSAAGRAAIDKEIGGLRQQTVWDESTVATWSSVKHQRHVFPQWSVYCS